MAELSQVVISAAKSASIALSRVGGVMTSIIDVRRREARDSRGNPTVKAEVAPGSGALGISGD